MHISQPLVIDCIITAVIIISVTSILDFYTYDTSLFGIGKRSILEQLVQVLYVRILLIY